MKDAFAKEQKLLESCQAPSFSFYQLIDDLWHQEGNPNPLHRLCTLMRKMKVKSFIKEELELNEELLEEQNMVTQRYNQKIGLTATRLTFFRSLPSPSKWDDPKKLPEDHLLGYAVIATLELPDDEVPSKNPNLHATRAIAIVPSGVRLSGLLAERRAVWIAQSLIRGIEIEPPVIWLERLAQQSSASWRK